MPPNTSMDNAKALGRLEGTVESMREMLERVMDAIERDREEARDYRERHNHKLDAVTETVDSLRADMDMVKPIAEKMQRWQIMGLGIIIAFSTLGSITIMVWTYFKTQIIQIISHL